MTATRIIFVAGMGTSPAVLTNAVWALAHQKKPVGLDEVVVLITKNGKELLRRELIANGVWEEMLAEMKREKIDIVRMRGWCWENSWTDLLSGVPNAA